MTEPSSIEDRVRRTLTAVAEQPLPPAALSLHSGPNSARPHPVRIFSVVLILAAVAVALLLAVLYGPHSGAGPTRPASVPASSNRGSTSTHVTKLPDTALTPRGWSPLSLGNVQISVPSAWLIEDPGITCGSRDYSMVFIDEAPSLPPSRAGCLPPINVVELSSVGKATLVHSHRATVNSIQVTESTSSSGSTTTEVVRALGMQVRVKGPLAAAVVATLTRSPLSVVLDSSVRSVPTGWQHVVFGGIRFAVPSQWRISRTTSWQGCLSNIEARVLVLSTAQVVYGPSCFPPPPTAGYLTAQPGMILGSGPHVLHAPANATCLRRSGLRICVDSPPEGFGHGLDMLTAQISVPKQTALDQIEIGLTGTGLTPLQIFDSMQPIASAHS
jgi:hypothetical protein